MFRDVPQGLQEKHDRITRTENSGQKTRVKSLDILKFPAYYMEESRVLEGSCANSCLENEPQKIQKSSISGVF